MAWRKTKIVAATAAGLLLLSGSAVVVHHYVIGGEKVVVLKPGEAVPPGSAGAASTPVSRGLSPPTPIALGYSGPPITGSVLDPTGKPLADAEVLVSSAAHAVSVYPSLRTHGMPGPTARTSADGHFGVRPVEQPSAIVVRAAAGYAAHLVSNPAKSFSIQVQPWARLEGTVRSGKALVPHAKLMVAQIGTQEDWDKWHVLKETEIVSDQNGHFTMDRVVPGSCMVGYPWPNRTYRFELPDGKTTMVNIGGDGRTIIGHVPPAARSFSFNNGQIIRRQPRMPQPPDWDNLSDEQKQKLQSHVVQ